MRFVKFTEENDHEGETWRFWLQLDGNEEALAELAAVITQYEQARGSDSEYQLDLDEPIPESEVDILIRHTRTGYHAYDTKVTGVLTVPNDLLQDGEYGKHLDRLYKADIVTLFRPAS